MSKTVVAYFSASGVTAKLAKTVASAVDGDLYEIQPQEPYSSADLDWMDANSRSSIEMRIRHSALLLQEKWTTWDSTTWFT